MPTRTMLAAVLMIMLKQKEKLSAHVEDFLQNPSVPKRLMETLKDPRHPLTVPRAKKITGLLRDPHLVRKWQKFLVPRMQTNLLRRLQQHPTEWTELPLVDRELAKRAKIRTQKERHGSPSKA